MGINKVQYGNTVLIDLTDTTAVASDVAAGKYFYGKDGVKTLGTGSGGEPNLQAKTYTVDSAGTATVTADGGYDGLSSVSVSVPSANPYSAFANPHFFTENGSRKWNITPTTVVDVGEGDTEGWIADGFSQSGIAYEVYAVASNTSVTPTTSAQTIGGANYMMEGAVTVNAMPIGTAGTPTATKGTVSNHSVSVTPSVTNTTGYITGSTKTGTAVTVSASELVSGSQTITSNQTVDVTNLAEIVVNVSGGGSTSIGEADATSTTASISFTGLPSEPTSFFIGFVGGSSIGLPAGTPYTTIDVVYDGTNDFGNIATNINNAQASYSTNFSHSYSNGTLTVTGTESNFIGHYLMLYTYGGSTSNIHTKDVQVGSGVTSITFTGLEGEPTYWSCAFKSNFGTSSGYQRTIATSYGYNTFSNTVNGYTMSTAVGCSATAWTSSYSNGSLTITSQGTNQGGYFHQPGYYQLTYAVDSSAPQYESVSKTYRASTSAQSETITPSSGYDAMSEVNITIPAVTQTNLTAANIKSGTTVTISNGNSNLWSVTGTYSGGGTSKNAQVVQGTTRTTSSTLTAIGAEMTVSKTGTYDVYWSAFRSSTSGSYTFGTQLYVDGVAYGTQNTTWSNHVQNNHLSNVSLTANQKIRVRGRNSRGSSYYLYAPTLVIIEA